MKTTKCLAFLGTPNPNYIFQPLWRRSVSLPAQVPNIIRFTSGDGRGKSNGRYQSHIDQWLRSLPSTAQWLRMWLLNHASIKRSPGNRRKTNQDIYKIQTALAFISFLSSPAQLGGQKLRISTETMLLRNIIMRSKKWVSQF